MIANFADMNGEGRSGLLAAVRLSRLAPRRKTPWMIVPRADCYDMIEEQLADGATVRKIFLKVAGRRRALAACVVCGGIEQQDTDKLAHRCYAWHGSIGEGRVACRQLPAALANALVQALGSEARSSLYNDRKSPPARSLRTPLSGEFGRVAGSTATCGQPRCDVRVSRQN